MNKSPVNSSDCYRITNVELSQTQRETSNDPVASLLRLEQRSDRGVVINGLLFNFGADVW